MNSELLAELSVIRVEFDQDNKVKEVSWFDAGASQDQEVFVRVDCSVDYHR